MAQHEDQINRLTARLELLLQRQEAFRHEIDQLRREINELRLSSPKEGAEEDVSTTVKREPFYEPVNEPVHNFSTPPPAIKEEGPEALALKHMLKKGLKIM